MAKQLSAATKKHIRMPAVGRMNKALLEEFDKIRRLWADANERDSENRYEIAVHCERIRSGEGKGGTYGKGAVAILAETLGKRPSIVYAYAQVPRAWPDANAFRKLLKRHGKFGMGLSWTHILHLAAVADTDRREKLITQALEEGWSAQKLKANINPPPQYSQEVLLHHPLPVSPSLGNANSQEPSSPPKLLRTFQVAIETIKMQVDALRANMDSFGNQMDRLIDEVDPSDLNPALMDRMKDARDELDALHRANSARFSQWIERIEAGHMAAIGKQDEWEAPPGTPSVAKAIDTPEMQPASAVAAKS